MTIDSRSLPGDPPDWTRGQESYSVVCLSHLMWDSVYQRPQHLMSRFAGDRRVIYVQPQEYDSTLSRAVPDVRVSRERTIVVTPLLPEIPDEASIQAGIRQVIEAVLRDHVKGDYILWFYTPMAFPMTTGLKPKAVVYDCMDELSKFNDAPPDVRLREAYLLERSDLVFTGGQSLYESKRNRARRVYCFPSSVDADHFRAARLPRPDPEDQADVARPRVGFYGVLDERFDASLVAAAAALRPEWQWILIGPVATEKIDASSLPRGANIYYLGAKTYDELPAYLAGWDAAILPFARNEATRFISPTKTPEYLAAGLPVVSTSINDVVRTYGSRNLVRIADDPDEFVDALEAAMAEHQELRRRTVDDFLQGISWDATWGEMKRLIDGVVASQAAKPRPTATPGSSAASLNEEAAHV